MKNVDSQKHSVGMRAVFGSSVANTKPTKNNFYSFVSQMSEARHGSQRCPYRGLASVKKREAKPGKADLQSSSTKATA